MQLKKEKTMIEVIKFGSEWCNPCKLMNPVIEKLKDEYNTEESEICIKEVDVDLNPEISNEHKIKTIPSIIFKVHGVIIERLIGVCTYSDIVKIINDSKL